MGAVSASQFIKGSTTEREEKSSDSPNFVAVVAGAPEETRSTLPFPKEGVRVGFLQTLVLKWGGVEALRGLTTTEVCQQFVMPATAEAKLSFCQLLTCEGSDVVAPAEVFISHAWKYQFLDVIDALLFHFRDKPEIVIWFDLFSNNQHLAPDLDFHWWSNTFKSAIAKFSYTVMVFAPWNDPIPLTRAWCLFELYCTVDTKSVFEVAMSHTHRQEFLQAILKSTTSSIDTMLATINVERSEAFKPEDRERIFAAVRATVGVAQLNALVFDRLRAWVVDTTLFELEKGAMVYEPLQILSLKNALANLYRSQALYDRALPLYEEVYEQFDQQLGTNHPDTLTLLSNLGGIYRDLGQFVRSEECYRRCLTRQEEISGPLSKDTLTVLHNLALAQEQLGQSTTAEGLFHDCIARKIQVYGESHPDTLATVSSLALLYDNSGQSQRALLLYEHCLAQLTDVLGPGHPHTLSVQNNLGQLLRVVGGEEYLIRAEALLVECLERRRTTLGCDHVHTLATQENLAGVLYQRRHYLGALSLLCYCYERKVVQLGDHHPATLTTMLNYGLVCAEMSKLNSQIDKDNTQNNIGNNSSCSDGTLSGVSVTEWLARAINLLNTCWQGRKTVLGATHAETRLARAQLALLYRTSLQYSLAVPLYEEIVADQMQQCSVSTVDGDGESPPQHEYPTDFFVNQVHLALCVFKAGNAVRAEEVLQRCLRLQELLSASTMSSNTLEIDATRQMLSMVQRKLGQA